MAITHKFFNANELTDIFNQVVSKKFMLQDSQLKMYPLEDVANLTQFKIFPNQEQITYLIVLNNPIIQFPAKLVFNYSFKFRYYRFLEGKLNSADQRSLLDTTENIRLLYNKISDYDESLVNYSYSELIRDTYSITTEEIDFRNYNDVKERVFFLNSENPTKSLLQQISFDALGFSSFQNIIINSEVKNILLDDKTLLAEYFGKLVNTTNDFNYKRFLNQIGIYSTAFEKKDSNILPNDLKTNLSNLSKFSEDGLFKKEEALLKTDNTSDNLSLFLAFVLLNENKYNLENDEEKSDYISFLSDPFEYPKYFFKHVLKFKLEYLSNVDPISLHETWLNLNQDNLQDVLNLENILCRVSLKNKKYFDKIAYEYFLVGA